MKLLIISDSHGHIANLKTAIEIGKKAGIKAIIHCGDWDNIDAFRAAISFGIPIYSVLGNADVDSDLEDALRFECKKFDSYLLKLEIDGRKIGVIHRANLKDEKMSEFNVIFSGHYHSKDERMINWTKFIRPGALINGINFAIYDTVSGTIEFINE
jgi:putative phosphoesterase